MEEWNGGGRLNQSSSQPSKRALPAASAAYHWKPPHIRSHAIANESHACPQASAALDVAEEMAAAQHHVVHTAKATPQTLASPVHHPKLPGMRQW